MEETFSVRSVPGLYNEDEKSVESFGCEKWQAGSEAGEISETQRKGERPPLETATKQRLVETEKKIYML
jgi:hypothetical protein